MNELVLYRHQGSAAIITLNRPEKRNALCRELIQALTRAFQKAQVDDQARAVILTGNGTAFCAGMDLEELRSTLDANSEIIWNDALALSTLFDLIYRLPKPTIAAVNGHAVAGGAGLMTICDCALSVPEAKMGYPEVRLGLVAAIVLPHLLRHVGERFARYLLLTGELVDANQALGHGLINETVPAEKLMDRALELAETFAKGGPHALAVTKQLLAQYSKQAESVAAAAQASAAPRLGEECRAGLNAFFSKQMPPWVKADSVR